MGQDRFRLIIMNKKRDFKISYFWGKELFQIKRKFREKNRLFVIKLCAIHDQLFPFVFSSFGLDFRLICFTVSLRTLFVLNTVYRFSNYLQHLLGLKMASTPSPSWISISLFGAKGELLHTRRGLRLEIKGICMVKI